MKILILPLLLVSLSPAMLFLIIKYWKKDKKISIWLKILLGIVFVPIGLVATYFAVFVSILGHPTGMGATGAIIFIPIGLATTLLVIPILASEKSIRKIT